MSIQSLKTSLESLLVIEGTDIANPLYKIPLTLKKNNDLRKVAELLSATLDNNSNKSVSTVNDLQDISKILMNQIDNNNDNLLLGVVDNVGIGISKSLTDAISTIKNVVFPEINNLKQLIYERYEKYIKDEGAEELLDDSTEPDISKLVFFDWPGLNSKSSNQLLITQLHNFAKLRNDTVTKSNLIYLSKTIDKEALKTKTVLLNNSIYDLFKSTSQDNLSKRNSLTSQDVLLLIDVVLNRKNMVSFWNSIKQKMFDSETPGNDIIYLLELMQKIKDFNGIKSISVDGISDNTIVDISNNVDILDLISKTIQYYGLHMKSVYSDKLMITDRFINKPVYDSIQPSIPLKNIVIFIRAIYNNNIPRFGVSKNVFLSKNIDSVLDSYNRVLKTKASYIKTKCLRRAFVNILRGYFSDIASIQGLDKESNEFKENKIQWYTIVSNYSSKLIGNIEEVEETLYSLLIDFVYHDTLVSQLYYSLQNNYKNLIVESDSDSVSDQDVLTTEIDTVVHIIVDYLMKNYCVIEGGK